MKTITIGIDWGSENHAVCALRDDGTVLDRFEAPHTRAGLAQALKRLGYPTPDSAARLGPKRLARFLARHRYSGRRSPEELLERLRTMPDGKAGTVEVEARRHVVLALVTALESLVASIRTLTSEINHAVAQLPQGQVVMSFPRTGKVNAAQIVAELGDDPTRFPTEASLAAQAGVAPVTYASGKRRGVGFRRAANKRLRDAITTWANNSRRASPWAQDIYLRARKRGCDHPHATRILARAWIRVLWRCWRDGTLYDPARHGAAHAFSQAA